MSERTPLRPSGTPSSSSPTVTKQYTPLSIAPPAASLPGRPESALHGSIHGGNPSVGVRYLVGALVAGGVICIAGGVVAYNQSQVKVGHHEHKQAR